MGENGGCLQSCQKCCFKRFKSVHTQATVLQSCQLKLLTLNLFKRWDWAGYLLMFTIQWLSLLTNSFRWDISAVSSCSFEKWFVNCHFELNTQYWQQPGISGRPITSPVLTYSVVSEPCPLCSEAIHSTCSSYTKWKPTCVESMTCWPFSTCLDIVKTCNFDIYHVAKKWSPAGLQYLGSAVALLHFSSHWLPGDQEFRALK